MENIAQGNTILNYDFAGATVRAINIEGEPWFVGNGLAGLLGYKRVGDAIASHIPEKDRKRLRYKEYHNIVNLWSGSDFSTKTLINKEGAKILIYKSRLPQAMDVWNALDLDVVVPFKEQNSINYLADFFYKEQMIRQYPVSDGKYRIDLYFPKYKLAIECDELGHIDRQDDYDSTRQRYIEDELECTFIRYNPDSPSFHISNVAIEILDYIRG